MKPCIVCGELTFGKPNKEVPSVPFTTDNDGRLSTGYYWSLDEPTEPVYSDVPLEIFAGLCNPVSTNSAYVEWLKERRRNPSAPPRSMRQLEEFLASARRKSQEAPREYAFGQTTGHEI